MKMEAEIFLQNIRHFPNLQLNSFSFHNDIRQKNTVMKNMSLWCVYFGRSSSTLRRNMLSPCLLYIYCWLLVWFNFELLQDHTASHPRRWWSLQSLLSEPQIQKPLRFKPTNLLKDLVTCTYINALIDLLLNNPDNIFMKLAKIKTEQKLSFLSVIRIT